MPIGPYGEIIGTTNCLEGVSETVLRTYKTKVSVPKNPKVVAEDEPKHKLTPSVYMFQMNMDTDKKLQNTRDMRRPPKVELLDMSETTHQRFSTVPIDEPLFQPFPSEIFFQKCEPLQTREIPLILRNNDKVPRLVKVVQADSPYFKIIAPLNCGDKVGPGLPTVYKIQFTPEDRRDYIHELVCITEREKFIVPVTSIGARALLDFPDDVNFGTCPVKHTTSKTLLVRNVGEKDAKFTLSVNKPFSVKPPNGVLPVNESMQVTVEFTPNKTGDHYADMTLGYSTGEKILITLHGAAQDANVRMDKSAVRIENTYIGMANQRVVTITNRTDVIAHYRWSEFATQESEHMQRTRFIGELSNSEKAETDRFLEECLTDPSLRDKMSIISRTFQNRRRNVDDNKMLFSDDVIKIEPSEGEIWPNSTAEITVIFKPDKADSYTRTAFCDITGRESRLPLKVTGLGIGPKVQFSCDVLDMGKIFIGSTHVYEIVLANKGDIDAIYTLVPSTTTFGKCFLFDPSESIVMPGAHQAIQVIFTSQTLGNFEEEFEFQVDGAPEKVKVKFVGQVIGPTFHFDVNKVKFGTVSYGFLNTFYCTLTNTALVPMTFSLRVPGDGGVENMSVSEGESTHSEAGSMIPKEFEITPSRGTLMPQSDIKIEIDFCSVSIKKYDCSLIVDVDGVGEEILSLPIQARCIVPAITVMTPIINYGRCFMRFPYGRDVQLRNDTDLPARYELLPQQVDRNTSILYSSSKRKGVIEPNSVKDVPLTIESQGLEELSVTAYFMIIGSHDAPLPVQLNCVGEGPVVHISPLSLYWGEIPVLTDVTRVVKLSNESLIPAKFTAHMVRPGSVWKIEPQQGEIPPEETFEISLTARVDDVVRFQDKLQINFLESQARQIPVEAYGSGTTIVTEMTSYLVLGPHFSNSPLVKTFKITNKGRRLQQLVWTTAGFPLYKPKKNPLLDTKDVRFKNTPAMPEFRQPVFQLSPTRMELKSGESCDLTIQGTVNEPQEIRERILCHSIIGRQGGKEEIMKVDLYAEFICPLLEFSHKHIFFRVDKEPGDALELQYKDLTLTNISSLPLTVTLSLKYPFCMMIGADGTDADSGVTDTTMTLSVGQEVQLKLQFDPLFKDDLHIRTADEVLSISYVEHPHVDYIALRGEVYFPNLSFEKTDINFGCVLNDTEVTRYVNVTNNSPMNVNYHWSFLIGDGSQIERRPRRIPRQTYVLLKEELPITPLPELPVAEPVADVGTSYDEATIVNATENPAAEAEDENAKDLEQEKDTQSSHPDPPAGGLAPVTGTTSPTPGTEPLITDDTQADLSVDVQPQPFSHPVSQAELVVSGSQDPEQLSDQPQAQSQPPQPHVVQSIDYQTGGEDVVEPTHIYQEDYTESRPVTRMGPQKPAPAINATIKSLLEGDHMTDSQLGVEEVFDILPLYGTLRPGETEQITLTFYGHADINSTAIALCHVEGGPTYEISLSGDSSLVEYRFDATEIDFGKTTYDQVASAEITLLNKGLVGFDFEGIGMEPLSAHQRPAPGAPILIPHKGYIEPMSEAVLTVKFLPGIPDKFEKTFQIQVAHFEPEEVTIFCEGIFPRITFDLPRYNDTDGQYQALVDQAKEILANTENKHADVLTLHEDFHDSLTAPADVTPRVQQMDTSRQPNESELQTEIERLTVKQFAESVTAERLTLDKSAHQSSRINKKKKRSRPVLPDYLLDFGHVILGTVRTHVVRVSNPGLGPVSFGVDHSLLRNHGFNVELDKVKFLPGAPDHEPIDFVVSFDPRGANLPLGDVDTVVPINIVNGPTVHIRLKANVTMPDMEVSSDVLEFGEVICGNCQIMTIQLHNHKHVRCEWSALPTEKELRAQQSSLVDKHMPMHLRRKMKPEKPKPKTFELMPATGVLMPGQRVNIQVKFMPTEERLYEQRLTIRLAQSSQRIMMLCKGQGLEPRLEFDRNLVEFGPVLPHSLGDEQDIVVRNPTKFPIEFYSLETDKLYLEEEKILRLMKGWDEYNTILLPPRQINEKLPEELTNFYEEQVRKVEQAEQAKKEQAESGVDPETEKADDGAEGDESTTPAPPSKQGTVLSGDKQPSNQVADNDEKEKEEDVDDEDKIRESLSSTAVTDLEITPVSAAIARHLGIDLSPDGKAARNRRGVAIILHGSPLSGKTTTAIALAKKYSAALLTIDGVILEAISNGSTPAGLKAKELCAETARRKAEEQKLMEAEEAEKKISGGGLSMEAVQAHTAGQAQVPNVQSNTQSMISKKAGSMAGGGKDKHQKMAAMAASQVDNTSTSQVPTSPPPLAAPIARRLSVSASVGGEEGLFSTVLPEELVCEILSDRLQLNDCHSGVIFDGIESLFCQNPLSAASCVLKAFNNRKYLFFVTLKYDYLSMKEQEKHEQEAKELAHRAAEEAEKQRLEEMDEDEYDALTDQEKADIDRKRLEIKRERRKKEQEEKMERERIEREKQEAEAKRLDEERAARKKKNAKDKDPKEDKGKDAKDGKAGKGKAALANSNDRVGNLKSQGGPKPHDEGRPESHMTHISQEESDKKKGKGKGDKNRPISNDLPSGPTDESQPQKEQISEAERLLMQRFKTFEVSLKDVTELVDRWDRTIGAPRLPTTPNHEDEQHHQTHPASGKKGRKDKDKDKHAAAKHEADKAAQEHKQAEKETADSEHAEGEEVSAESDGDGIGIGHILVDINDRSNKPAEVVLQNQKLPQMEEVLDGLGLGDKGPPIPPPASFSVIPYPVRRKPPTGEAASHYMFVASGPDDPNLIVDDKSKEDEDEKVATPDKPENITPTGKRKDKAAKEKAEKLEDTKKEKRKPSAGRGKAVGRRGSGAVLTTPPPGGAATPGSEVDGQKLTSFRWTVPANGEVILRLRFASEDLGQYDQTMNFELVGTRRRYQLYCRGVCSFPTISREPRIVFPSRVKTKKSDDILHKQYVLSTETFEFGPLLAGQNRETMKANRFPEHNEKLTVLNTSPMEAEISFCYLDDSKGDCFMLDPPNVTLKPGAQQELNIYAFPRSKEFYEDQLICCIKENPEPIIFKVSCHGCRPELEVDKKTLQFDKVLLHRKDTKTIYLRNTTLIPVGWRLSGMENLGEDFSVTVDSGVVEPRTEFALQAHFRATKPVITNRKSIRLEILDSDDQYGIVEAIPIHVHAEAYDVALDMSFPKGTDGGIDFGTVKVGEEGKSQLTLKNKGKYEIAFSFSLENPSGPQTLPDVTSLFTVIPQKGTLTSTDRPSTVLISFKSNTELTIKDLPILRCQVIEPNVSEGGETIASIPVKLSVKSVFSKYTIAPKADINFGSLLVNFKKTRTFTIENNGQFDFKYSITRAVREMRQQQHKSRPNIRPADKMKSRDGSSSGKASAAPGGRPPRRTDSIRQDIGNGPAAPQGGGQSRLQLGMFTIFPAFGIILPNGHATVTVDCAPETVGKCEEDLSIEIAERDPTDCPGGIHYKLLAEACIPGININDIGSIFEEHRICHSLSMWQQTAAVDVNSVYGEDENKFLFNNVIVGRRAKARFKLSNLQKVPCDLNLAIKPVSGKFNAKSVECFEIEAPTKLQIPAHSHVYATVLFSPNAMQSYSAIFEAAIEGVPPAQAKSRNLSFEIAGDGNLPRITICRPNIRNKKGQPLLLFRKNLVGQKETLPLVIINEGCLDSKVYIDLLDQDGVFKLTPTGNSRAFLTDGYEQDRGMKKPHTCSVLVSVGEQATFDVTYSPKDATRTQASIQLSVEDNQYEDSLIQMVGEGYFDEITLDNLHSVAPETELNPEDGTMADDDIAAAKSNLIRFGDSAIDESKTLSFTMTNHSQADCLKFCWPEHPCLKFSPNTGHIHVGMHKDMTVTFKTDKTVSMAEEPVLCNITKISFDKDVSQLADWDDRMRTVRWIDVPQPNSRPAKKKVTEVEVEPIHTEIAESQRTVELLVSANSDFSKYKCKTELIKFKDTLMFQTRVYEVQIHNKGASRLDYNWQIVMEEVMSPSRSVTFAAAEHPDSRAGSMTPSVVGDSTLLYQPFTIEPLCGTIPQGKKQDFKVKFSPLDLSEYEARLVCTVPNLEEGKQGPVICVKARSQLPYCHFELNDSDYISSARRNPEMRGPGGAPPGTTLDPNTRVIEFKSIGVGVKSIKRFSIINPTSDNYTYQWINDDEQDPKTVPSFKCLTGKANVKSGKKQEILFEFTSRNLGITESFWKFVIPEQNISVPFLLVGQTRDPAVNFDRSHLNFKALLIGHEAVETVYMSSSESTPFSFSFEDISLYSAGQKDKLRVEPVSGVIEPNTKIPISLYFTPKSDKEVNFNLSCLVKKKTSPLRLNVKAEGYCMNTLVVCEDSIGSRVELTSGGLNSVNFGNVEINEESIRNITIFNSGKFNFDYTWELIERPYKGVKTVSVSPEFGAIDKEGSQKCILTFMPTHRMALVGCELRLKISHGPTYHINVTGTGVAPGLHFSFLQHNFGPCFIYRAGMPIHSAVLKVTNRDKKDISLDCLFEPTRHLHHDFEAQVIPANQTVDMLFSFYPREAKKYRDTVEFEINGLSRQRIDILGMGTEMKVEVANPSQKITKLGALRVGQIIKKTVPLVNNSPSSITFTLTCTPSTPELQHKSVLKISPLGPITLEPKGGSCKVEVVFSPKSRIPQFTEEVLLECAGMFQPVFVMQGCCQGMEIGLDTEAIAFGSVVQKSQSIRKVIMSNTGDIGSRFRWDSAKFAPDYSIVPANGYISPGMDVTFEVHFHPGDINADIRYENLKCFLEGSSPLKLTLTGMCTGVPAFKEVQHFTSHVRNKETKNLVVINRTNQLWQLKPIIDGEYWSGADWFIVEPQTSRSYELTYYPLTMTHEGKKHQGTIFFPLPDGNGLLYNLVGTSTEPKVSAKLTKEVPCKTNAVELLPVQNWLKKPQRFRVRIEPMKPDKFDVGTTVKGLDYIDVPPNSKRDYKLNFHAHKEGITMCKVTFTNEQTSEYQWIEVGFKAVKSGALDLIQLTTPVRQSTQYSLNIKNPLTNLVTFATTCTINEVALPSQIAVPAESEGVLTIEFLPLTVKSQIGKIELSHSDLGVYLYELECNGTQSGPEKALYFRCSLGSHQTLSAKFLNFAKQKTEYICKMENSTDFSCEKTINAAPASSGGTETSVDVTFEPSHIGEMRSTLTITSPVGGDYTFPIFATCTAPKPQGPFVIKSGAQTYITFRNYFPSTTAFTFTVDNPAFHVSKTGDNIRGKKDHRIVIGFDGADSASRAPVMGKLIVSCARSAGGNTPAQWVYYLKGVPADAKEK